KTGHGPQWVIATALIALLGACAPGGMQFGSRTLNMPFPQSDVGSSPRQISSMPAERFGRGPVPVTLILLLSGEPGLAQVGTSMANASKLAVAYIEANPNIAENITISLRDSGDSVAGASAA